MPAPDAVNAAMPALATEAGFFSVPRLVVPGDPLLSARMLTLKVLRVGVPVVWISTLVSA